MQQSVNQENYANAECRPSDGVAWKVPLEGNYGAALDGDSKNPKHHDRPTEPPRHGDGPGGGYSGYCIAS